MKAFKRFANFKFVVVIGLATAVVTTDCVHAPPVPASLECRSPAQVGLNAAACKAQLSEENNDGRKIDYDHEFTGLLETRQSSYHERMLENISPRDEHGVRHPGAIVASPSHANPDYFYDWLRDSSFTMQVVVRLYRAAPAGAVRAMFRKMIIDFVEFNLKRQDTPNPSGTGEIIPESDPEKAKTNPFKYVFEGYGEPKEYVTGQPFTDGWGRPQSDGAACRAIAMVQYAQALLATGDPALKEYVHAKLYDSKYPTATKSLIKRDLEYVLHNWTKNSFDVWEEVLGSHFFTLMNQRRALIRGAVLAEQLGDHGAVQPYLDGAERIRLELEKFWDADRQILTATRNYERGVQKSGLDMATVFGALYGSDGETMTPLSKKVIPQSMRCSDDRVLATMYAVEMDSKARHIVNHAVNGVEPIATLIERYPEDVFDGDGFSGGNPWVITTFGAAEHAYRVADELLEKGSVLITDINLAFYQAAMQNVKIQPGQKIVKGTPVFNQLITGLMTRGDHFIKRVYEFGGPNGELAEEINRNATKAGPDEQRGAQNLTWNYVAHDRAVEARRRVISLIGH